MATRNPLRPVQNKPTEWKKRKSEAPGKRRQTTTNSRASLAPRASLAQNPSTRASLAPNQIASRPSLSLRRQSSIGGRLQGKANDARKQMEANIRKIIEFLSLRNYPGGISFKSLSQPSVKDFQDITLFLIQEVDPTFEWKSTPEEEIPKFFRNIRCPHNLNKSSLRSVGSIATWPSVLQALSWLVDLLNYQAAEQEKRFQSDEDLHQKLFFDFLSLTYEQFLQEGKETFEELEADLSQFFAQRNSKVQESLEDINLENQALLSEIQRLENENQQVPVTKRKLADHQVESRKLQDSVTEWQSHRDKIHEHNEVLSKKLHEANEELEEAQKEQQEVLAKLDKQEMKSEDVQRLYSDRTQLQQELQLVMKHHQALQVQHTELQQQLQGLFKETLPTLTQYNQLATAMKLIPASAKYAQGYNFEVSLRPPDLHDEQFNIEIKKDIKLNIMKLKETFRHKWNEYEESRLLLEHNLQQEREKHQEKEEDAIQAREQLEEKQELAEQRKRQLMEEHQVLQTKVNGLRETSQRLEKTSKEELAEAQQHHEEVQAHYTKEKEAIEQANEAQVAKYQEVCSAIMSHKAYLEQHFETLCANVRNSLYQLE